MNFKGCVEKDELLRILERLWRQEQRHKEEGDTMDDDSMCKICMDSPVAILLFWSQSHPSIHGPDRLRDVGVRAHVHLHPVWQADGRVPHLPAICCQVTNLGFCHDPTSWSFLVYRVVKTFKAWAGTVARVEFPTCAYSVIHSYPDFKPVPVSRFRKLQDGNIF